MSFKVSVNTKERVPVMWEKAKAFEIDTNDEDMRAATREQRVRIVTERVTLLLQQGKFKLPMLPHTATEALSVANDARASLLTIERTVAKDPLITARVLAVANSARYAGLPVSSLSRALQRLGTSAIRDVLYQAVAEAHIFRGKAKKELAAEKEHAIGVGEIARDVCRLMGADPEQVFVCGLLHDVGRVLLIEMMNHLPPDFLDDDEKHQVVTALHTTAGKKLSESWKLPALVLEACERHHSYLNFQEGDSHSQIGNIIAVADRLAEHHGIGRPKRPVDLTQEGFLYELGFDEIKIQQLLEQPPSAAA